MAWQISACVDYLKVRKDFSKKYPHEMRAVAGNLLTLFQALENGAKPEQLKSLGFVHGNYPLGILSIDETGHEKQSKPKALRLYLYPCEAEQVVYAMLLGEKDARQPGDVKLCKHFVEQKTKELAAQKSETSKSTAQNTEER
jgi:hypothetical protein